MIDKNIYNGYSLCFNEWALDTSIKNELGLLQIISSLTAERGYCYAGNEYFAELFQTTEETISRRINKLEKKGYITITYHKNGCTIDKRQLRLTKMSTAIDENINRTIDKNVKENITSNNIINKEKVIKEKHIPPTLEEVTAYCKERNNRVDPQKFIDFYSSKGWLVGKVKMKDWQASVRTWERADNKPREKQFSSERTYSEQELNKIFGDSSKFDNLDL